MDVRLLITPPPLPIKTENDASSVIREDDPRDGLMVPLRTGVHARPAHLVDEVPFCDLSKEGITPEHTCDFHAEDWRGVSCCMFASYMLPQNTVVCFFAESVCMLLPSVVRVVNYIVEDKLKTKKGVSCTCLVSEMLCID